MKNQKFKSMNGITLIALVVTIVVLLILAGVSINAIFSENGIIKRAQDAQNKMDKATQNDLDAINGLNEWIDGKINGTTGEKNEPVTNPYDSEGWEMAWVCNDGTWDNTPITKGNKAEGDIVAKFYKTEEKVTPGKAVFMGNEFTFQEGDAYKMVIEGIGTMPELMTQDSEANITGASAWQLLTAGYLQDQTIKAVIPYVTEAIVCDGITSIGAYAFGGATSLTKVNLSQTITSIGKCSFAGAAIPTIDIPSDLKSIEESVFDSCTNLANITIPDSVTSIEKCAFSGCTNLTNITIPNGVTSIGIQAFSNCTGLTKIVIPGSVEKIEGKKVGNTEYQGPFYECTNLKTVIINEGVKEIGINAFSHCPNLTDITIPSSVTTIGRMAFYGCESLINITIPNGVTNMGEFIFVNCTKLAKIKILTVNLEEVGYPAFDNASGGTLASNSKIYVLSEEIKTKLEGTYDTTKTTVEVVTAEQMAQL